MTDKKAARFRVGNDVGFTRVGTRPARGTPTPDQFPLDEIPFESPAAKGVIEREHRTDAELLEDPEEELLAGSDFPAAPKRPFMARDPAAAAARLMVLRSARQRPKGVAHPAKARMSAVAVPAAEWLPLVAEQWQAHFQGGSRPGDGNAFSRYQQPTGWILFTRGAHDCTHGPDRGNDAVAHAAWHGNPVVGLATSPHTQLPRDLIRVADCRLTVGPLDAAILSAVIREVTGRAPKGRVPDGLGSRLTPALLRLARRPRQSADAYLAQLAEMAAEQPGIAPPGPSLADLHGMDKARAWGERWIADVRDYRDGKIAWHEVDAGLLLHGVPGTGKTLFAQALARSAGVPLIATSFSQWQASGKGYLGDCLTAMRQSFAEAMRRGPSILFVDELDAIGKRGGGDADHVQYWTTVVTCFLELADGVGKRPGMLLLGATNDPGALDPAILRAGRMDRLIEITRPDLASLGKILRHHLGDDLGGSDILAAARLAVGGTGADCALWVRTARQAARHARRPLEEADLLDAIGTVALPPEIERRIAVHEAGHAVVTTLLRPEGVVEVRLGSGGGFAGSVETTHETRSTRESVHGTLIELLAGRAAEEVILGGYSGGSGGTANSDLAMATCLSVALETALGLGSIGPVWLGLPTSESVGPMLALRPALAARVQAHLEAVHVEAAAMIRERVAAVSAVADALVAARSLTGAEIAELVARHPPGSAPGSGTP